MPSFTSVPFQQPQMGGGVSMSSVASAAGGSLNKVAKTIDKINKIQAKFRPIAKNLPKIAAGAGKGNPAEVVLKTMELGQKIGKKVASNKVVKHTVKKLGGKKAMMNTAVGAVAGGVAGGGMYMDHLNKGGQPLTATDMKKMVTNAGINVVDKALKGTGLNKKTVGNEIVKSFRTMLAGKRGEDVTKLDHSVHNLGSLMRKLNTIHKIRHIQTYGTKPKNLLGPRPFGSGKSGLKKKAKKRKGKKKKGRKKSTKRGGAKRKGKSRKKKGVTKDLFDVY